MSEPKLEELDKSIAEIVSTVNLEEATKKSVRKTLEAKYGVSLKHRKDFINESLVNHINTRITLDRAQEAESKSAPTPKKKKKNKKRKEISPSRSPSPKPEPRKKFKVVMTPEEVQAAADLAMAQALQAELGGRPRRGATASFRAGIEKRGQKRQNAEKRRAAQKADPSLKKPARKMALSADLQEFLEVDGASRGEVVSMLWAYIKKHELQNPEDKRQIVCDEKMQTVFGVKTMTMFRMNKLLAKHIKDPRQM